LRVTLAPRFNILAGSGEMLAEWSPLLEPVCRGGTTLLSGYLAGPALYVPTSAEVSERGYEVKGFQKKFVVDGEYDPEISRLVLSAVEHLFDRDIAMA
jgi:hypothetical protein